MGVYVRVVTPVVPTGLTLSSDFEGLLGPDDRVDFTELDVGPISLENSFDEVLAAPGTVARIIEAEQIGADAVVIDCMEDPGLQAGREAVSIPVLGPCETCMHLACTLGRRFSVLSVSARMRTLFEARARIYGVSTAYASTRAVDIPVVDLEAAGEVLLDRLHRAAREAVLEDLADTLILGCTGMKGVAAALQDRLRAEGLDVPVIDPIPTTVRLAKALATSGLSHSKAAYPTPLPKPIRGFDGTLLQSFSGRPRT